MPKSKCCALPRRVRARVRRVSHRRARTREGWRATRTASRSSVRAPNRKAPPRPGGSRGGWSPMSGPSVRSGAVPRHASAHRARRRAAVRRDSDKAIGQSVHRARRRAALRRDSDRAIDRSAYRARRRAAARRDSDRAIGRVVRRVRMRLRVAAVNSVRRRCAVRASAGRPRVARATSQVPVARREAARGARVRGRNARRSCVPKDGGCACVTPSSALRGGRAVECPRTPDSTSSARVVAPVARESRLVRWTPVALGPNAPRVERRPVDSKRRLRADSTPRLRVDSRRGADVRRSGSTAPRARPERGGRRVPRVSEAGEAPDRQSVALDRARRGRCAPLRICVQAAAVVHRARAVPAGRRHARRVPPRARVLASRGKGLARLGDPAQEPGLRAVHRAPGAAPQVRRARVDDRAKTFAALTCRSIF